MGFSPWAGVVGWLERVDNKREVINFSLQEKLEGSSYSGGPYKRGVGAYMTYVDFLYPCTIFLGFTSFRLFVFSLTVFKMRTSFDNSVYHESEE